MWQYQTFFVGGPCPVCVKRYITVIDVPCDEWFCVSLYSNVPRRHDGVELQLPSPKSNARFNKPCARCGQPAYTGLNVIEHQEPELDRVCPAPRATPRKL